MKLRALEPPNSRPTTSWPRPTHAVFNRLDWLALFGSECMPYGLFDDGASCAAACRCIGNGAGDWKNIRRPPFTPICGRSWRCSPPIPSPRSKSGRRAWSAWRSTWTEAARRSAWCRCAGLADGLPFFWRGIKVVPHYTYLLDLAQTPEQLRANMRPTANDVSKASATSRRAARTDMATCGLVLASSGGSGSIWIARCWRPSCFVCPPDNIYAFVVRRAEQPSPPAS
jgi:hypothetical protein